MCDNYFMLGKLTYNQQYIDRAIRCLNEMEADMVQYPSAYFHWWNVYQKAANTFYEVVLVGEYAEQNSLELMKEFQPNKLLAWSESEKLEPEILNGKAIVESALTFYVCKQNVCLKPSTQIHEVIEQIKAQ